MGKQPAPSAPPVGVGDVGWEAARAVSLDDLVDGECWAGPGGAVGAGAGWVPDAEEADWWAFSVEYDSQLGARYTSGLVGDDLLAQLRSATRAVSRAGLDEDEAVGVFDAQVAAGLEEAGRLAVRLEATVVTLAVQAHSRGLHTEKGLSLVDWLRVRCPWLPSATASAIRVVVACLTLSSTARLRQVATGGLAPLHRCAMVARMLNRIVNLTDHDSHEAYTVIVADAAANPDISDAELALICARIIHDLLDATPDTDRTAQELRGVSRRPLGEGLTRFTVDAPDAAAASIDGVLTGALAAPAPGVDEDGAPVPDERSATQRRFDAFMTVLNRGLGNPGAAPSSARAAVILTMPFDPATGQPAGPASTPAGIVLSPRAAGQIACSGVITPVWLSTNGAPLKLGREARYATPEQFKALVARDKHCTFPGCTRLPQWCDTHHLTWWSRGGRTDTDDMVLLCETHHTHVHLHDIHAQVHGGTIIWHL
ncbi:DUF222 domain-containing protein [Ornithinimicrobium sp. Y1694]|uniref:HNH endonuclease signature motif containing protein n=1 Tax=Ornithinimicrobium sp. Y1694 TaxID=3418590 RepID=UPI003CF7FB20